MKTILKTAFRNIFRQKKRTMLLAGAIAFGMLMITLVNGFTGGMVSNVRDNFSNALGGHVFVSGQEITDTGQIISRMGADEPLQTLLDEHASDIAFITRRSQTFGTVIFGSRQALQLMYGVDFAAEEQVLDSLAVVEGRLDRLLEDPNSIILPVSLARRLDVNVGEAVLLRMDTVTGQQNVGEFRVAALIEDQAELGMSAAYGHLAYLNSLLNLPPGSFQSLNLFLHNMDAVDTVAAGFRDVLPIREGRQTTDDEMEDMQGMGGPFFGGARTRDVVEPWDGVQYSITTINDIMEPVEAIVGVLNTIALGVFAILLLIIMVGITNTFRMIVMERTKEIGTMRALGMQQPMVRRIFLAEAGMLGLLGGAIGLVLALLAMSLLSLWTVTTPGLQFFLAQGSFSFDVGIGAVLLYFGIMLGICLSAAHWPATSAAKLSPIKALGSHF